MQAFRMANQGIKGDLKQQGFSLKIYVLAGPTLGAKICWNHILGLGKTQPTRVYGYELMLSYPFLQTQRTGGGTLRNGTQKRGVSLQCHSLTKDLYPFKFDEVQS